MSDLGSAVAGPREGMLEWGDERDTAMRSRWWFGSVAALAFGLLVVLVAVPAARSGLKTAAGVSTDLIILVGCAAVIILVCLVAFRALRRRKGLFVVPFEVTGQPGLAGAALADLFIARLRRICEVHAKELEPLQAVDGRTEKLAMPSIAPGQEDFKAALTDLGTVSLGGFELSIGGLLRAAESMRTHPELVVVRGNAQGAPDQVELIVRVESQGRATAFVSEREASATATIDLMDSVVYEILVEGSLTREPEATSWRALKHFTDALEQLSLYYDSRDIAKLQAAQRSAERAIRTQRRYRKVFAVAYNVGLAYLNEGDPQSALAAFTTAHHAEPQNASVLVGLGMAHHRLGQYRLAIEHFTQAHALAGKDDPTVTTSALAGLGNAWSDCGDVSRAVEYFTQAVEISRTAHDELTQAQNLSRLARRYADRGESHKAVAQARKAVELFATSDDSSTRCQLLDNLAAVLGDDRQHEEALSVAREAVQTANLVPSLYLASKANLTFARLLLFVRRPAEAALAAEGAALAQSGFRHTALAFRGVAAARLDRTAEAQEHFRAAIEESDRMVDADPRNFGALYAKALSLDGLAAVAKRQNAPVADVERLTAGAAEVRRRAVAINAGVGVTERQARLVEALHDE